MALVHMWFLLVLAAGCLGCSTPPAVDNATVTISNLTAPSGVSVQAAIYTCDANNGYVANGNTTIICVRIHGYVVWTSVQFRCERVQCSTTPSMAHATTTLTERHQQSKLVQRRVYGRYYDRYGYGRDGAFYIHVTEYYIGVSVQKFYYTSHVTFTCVKNYFLSNGSQNANIYCGEDGNWITPDDTCQGKDCGPLRNEGMTCIEDSTRFPTNISCTCDKGYDRTAFLWNNFTMKCLSSGTWTPPEDGGMPYCTKVECGAPPGVENSDSRATVTTGTVYEDRATYKCLAGYEMTSPYDTASCQANRTWTPAPKCVAKNCGKPPEVENGHTSRLVFHTTFNSEVEYSCDGVGYNIAGAPIIRCLTDGTWSSPPICHRINCGSPPYVPNSERHVVGHLFNDTVRYVCDVGYYAIGDQHVVCQYTGHWTVPPVCKGEK